MFQALDVVVPVRTMLSVMKTVLGDRWTYTAIPWNITINQMVLLCLIKS